MASENESGSPAPRRSQREKKTAKPFVAVGSQGSTKGKRKRDDNEAEDEVMEDVPSENEGEVSENEEANDADEEEGDYRASKPKVAGKRNQRKNGLKAKGAPPPKKLRTAKGDSVKVADKVKKRGRKPKEGADAYDAALVTEETKISADNPLFNAVMNPAAALQSTAEDFLESLEQSPGSALAELINLILRSCGCNDSVDENSAVDLDGVVDALDNFTEALKQDNSAVYPLTSKLPIFKKFRRSLSEFIERLISSSAELGVLYTSDLMETLQTWVVAMSSSQIRSFRHTATVVALGVETALCDVAAAVEKEAEVVGRQREGEKKRKGQNKASNARLKELETKSQEVRDRRTKLAEFLKEFVDGVFVHRYRDLDPNIRAECVHSIGLWFRKYPGHFLDATYLRYVGWVLSDSNTHVRIEAVKSLSGVYDQADFIASLNHFTERFKPRLIEMATSDTELSVRIAVIQVLGAIDSHSLLEEEERESMCLLIFDEESKVRKAVSKFVKGVWDETVEERLVGHNRPSEEDKQKAGMKAIAMLLVKWGKALQKRLGQDDDTSSESMEDDRQNGNASHSNLHREVSVLLHSEQKGRTALAVEALWEEVESIDDWEGILEFLLLDHSASEEVEPRARGKKKKAANEESAVDEAWRLEEVEETTLLEVLITAIRRAKADAALSKKGEEEVITNDITRELIKGLPRLFIKYQTDQNRIADILQVIPLMNLDLYVEMRMVPAYASLWDDVLKQFLSHYSPNVLTNAVAAFRQFLEATSLTNTNKEKVAELENELSTVLRDTVAGREEIELASFNEDEVHTLEVLCTRLAMLAGSMNPIDFLEDTDEGKQTAAWELLNALVERGRLGYKEEAAMVEQALHVLTLHIIWKARGLSTAEGPTLVNEESKTSLIKQRESLLEKLVEYAVGTQSNTSEKVKRAAFKHLLDLHVLFSAQTIDSDGRILPTATVPLALDDETQYRCAGYVQAEIEQYAELIQVSSGKNDADADKGSDEEDSDNDPASSKKIKKATTPEVDANSRVQLEQEYMFIDVVSTFLRAIRAGAVQIRHGAILLAHYAQLGPTFDACAKVIVDVLREDGMMNERGEVIVSVLTHALQEAFSLVLDGVIPDESDSVQLAKLLSSCFLVRGSQLAVIRRLDPQLVVEIHLELISWISKRLATYESNQNKKAMRLGISFFRALVPLAGAVQNKDALKIKAHLDQSLAQASIEPSLTSKLWEPLRAYEKKLIGVPTKEKGSARRGGAKKGNATTDDERTDGEGPTDDEARPSPPKRRSGRLRGEQPTTSEEEADHNESDHEDVVPPTPKPKPRPKARMAAASLAPDDKEEQSGQDPSFDEEAAHLAAVDETPRASRKRTRTDGDVDMESNPDGETGENALNTQESDAGEVVRRKRVRH